jgi:hypothetical protein
MFSEGAFKILLLAYISDLGLPCSQVQHTHVFQPANAIGELSNVFTLVEIDIFHRFPVANRRWQTGQTHTCDMC